MLATLLLWLAGCAGIELSSTPPPGFDLSGRWVLVPEASDEAPPLRRLRSRGGLLSFITQDFPVLRAETLTIEQNRDSMGIAYDGRDYRDVSWGTRERGLWKVRAGWHEGRLMILWDADDADARQILSLSPDGNELRIDVRVKSGGENVAVSRVYRRR